MPTTRRTFLAQTASGALAMSAAASDATAANEQITLAAIGCGGQGTYLLTSFARQKDVRLAYVCDPDTSRAAKAAHAAQEITGKAPKVVHDLRRILDDKSIDAVTVATPDHWHAPATLLACQAGKHVYVEKPCAHNIREGRLMIDAARKHNRVVQVGTQSRSAEHVRRAIDLLRSGAIGDVLVAKAWNSQLRNNIGHAAPSEPPAGIDYDLWVGPAPFVPFQPNRHHYNWHWWYDFGTGDMGNDGVHDIDIARWGLGVETHPTTVAAIGGKYFFDDDQQFPDTQYVVFEYPSDGRVGHKKQLIFEQRIWSPYVQEGYENGNAFYGTKGMLLLSKGSGFKLFGPRNEPRESMNSTGLGPAHHRNFLDCIKSALAPGEHTGGSGQHTGGSGPAGTKRPYADIEIGHLSATLCHLGNISTRLARTLRFDPKTESIVGDDQANLLTRRTYRDGHWAIPKNV